jgi:hypothetical protein
MLATPALARAAPASDAAPAPAPADDPLTIYVLTFGPGDHPFFKFGHNALWIHDRAHGTDRVYNFGTFKFDSWRLIPDFMQGRLTYWLSVTTIRPVLASYERENRSVGAQELALPPAEKALLQSRLDENARPENRAYKYDYFLDNCSTRVRDAVDRATGGRLHATAHGPARLTLREQALRLTADHVPLYVALDLLLASPTDRPIDRWAEMFIPEELARGLRTVADDGGSAGQGKLVASEQVLFHPQTRPEPPELPPARGVSFLLSGLALGLVFTALGWGAPGRTLVRVTLGLLIVAWGLAVGVVGCFLAYLWAFTDHVVAHRNENILLCAPWTLLLAFLGFGVAAGSAGATRKTLWLVFAALLAAFGGWALKLDPAFRQHNGELIAFFLPAWLGLALGLAHLRRDLDLTA